MTDILTKQKHPWGSAPNVLLNDQNISLKAKGCMRLWILKMMVGYSQLQD